MGQACTGPHARGPHAWGLMGRACAGRIAPNRRRKRGRAVFTPRAPGVARAADELAGRLKVVKVDVDVAPEVSARFGVQGIPTLLILRDGRAIARQVGALPADRLLTWVRGVVDTPA